MTQCHKILVPEEACTLTFGEGEYSHTLGDLETVRGEQVFIDLDQEGKIINIELVSDTKPCQRSEE